MSKFLLVSLNGTPSLKPSERVDVMEYSLIDDFYNELGEAIGQPAVFASYRKESPDGLQETDGQWKTLQSRLWGTSVSGKESVTLPEKFIEWLQKQDPELCKSLQKGGKVKIDLAKFYDKHIKTKLLPAVVAKAKGASGVFFDDEAITAKSKIAVAAGHLTKVRVIDFSDVEAFKLFSESAGQGFASAQYRLGNCYYNGQGVQQDYAEAVKWYRKAAEQGHVEAQASLGHCYDYGEGVEKDYVEASKWYSKAVKHGNARAEYDLGWLYRNGQGVKRSYDEAVKWFSKAVEHGNVEAQVALGNCYENMGDYAKARKWYSKAAEQGNAGAKYDLGLLYFKGQGVKQDYAKAVKLFNEAAEQGCDKALKEALKIADIFYCAKNYSVDPVLKEHFAKTFDLLKNSFEQGDAKLQDKVGEAYLTGEVRYLLDLDTDVKQEYVEAVKWYRKAAGQGYSNAQFHLGDCYHLGMGVEMDKAEAEKWYDKSAEEDVKKLVTLGNFIKKTDGVEALKWYKKAVEKGYLKALDDISSLYIEGAPGVKKDYVESMKWRQRYAEGRDYHEMLDIGRDYYRGYHAKKDYAEAMRWFLKFLDKATNDDHDVSDAQKGIGNCYLHGGYGVKQDYAEATKWYLKAYNGSPNNNEVKACLGDSYYAMQNYAEAVKWYTEAGERGSFGLGQCYLNGYGVKQSYSEAINYFIKCTKLYRGDSEVERLVYKATNILGKLYFNGAGTIKINYNEAFAWFKAYNFNKFGDLYQVFEDDFLYLGKCYYNGLGVSKDYNKAVRYYCLAAENGYDEALQWLIKEADGGSGKAQFALVRCYYFGTGEQHTPSRDAFRFSFIGDNQPGIKQDKAEAVKWLKKAANNNNSDAMKMFAECYSECAGVNLDKVEVWYKAEFNDPIVFRSFSEDTVRNNLKLAQCYYNGDGVEQDIDKAIDIYYHEADSHSSLEAFEKLKELAEQGLSKAQYWLGKWYDINSNCCFEKERHEITAAKQGKEIDEETAEEQEAELDARARIEAIKWYRMAAEQGVIEARKRLFESFSGFIRPELIS